MATISTNKSSDNQMMDKKFLIGAFRETVPENLEAGQVPQETGQEIGAEFSCRSG